MVLATIWGLGCLVKRVDLSPVHAVDSLKRHLPHTPLRQQGMDKILQSGDGDITISTSALPPPRVKKNNPVNRNTAAPHSVDRMRLQG
jgi:hypothetical protein